MIVKFKKTYGAQKIAQTAATLKTAFQAQTTKKWKIGAELWKFELGKTNSVITAINNNPLTEYAEPNYVYTADVMSSIEPNVPYYSEQWGLHNTGQTGGTPDADIDAPEAWEMTTGDSNIIVGVIDSGIDYTHPDLAANMWINPGEIPDNGIDDDGNGYVDDVYGYDWVNDDSDPEDEFRHGTCLAGIIGAEGNNERGITGINWDIKMIALKTMNDCGFVIFDKVVNTIEYATDNSVRIINCSWGGSGYSESIHDAIVMAANEGILFIASAGNDNNNTDYYPHYPASYDIPNIISVSSTDHNDLLSGSSNWGFNSVDLGERKVLLLR